MVTTGKSEYIFGRFQNREDAFDLLKQQWDQYDDASSSEVENEDENIKTSFFTTLPENKLISRESLSSKPKLSMITSDL